MAKVITTELQHAGASSANITLDSSKNVTVENNLTVDGNISVAGTGLTDTLSFRNLIINGAMQVAQKGTSSTDTGFKTLDRIAYYKAGTQTQSQADITSATSGPYASGFRKCYKVTNGSNTAGNTDAATFQYSVEDRDLVCSGWNHTDPNSKLTLSFWARSSVAQTFYFQIRTKHGTNQGYWSSYALSANTWTKVTKTIPGYANIELANDSGNGMNLAWNTYYGTDNTGSGGLAENTWGAFAGNASTPDQTVTWQNTNAATFELTGVQLEVGSTATDFEHRSYADELLRCQRYLRVYGGHAAYQRIGIGYFSNTSRLECPLTLAPQMRTTPTMTVSDAGHWKAESPSGSGEFTAVGLDGNSSNQVAIVWGDKSSSFTAGESGRYLADNTTDARIYLSAEL